uniref:BTB domain-containing protein n=1 Tax=Oryza punctata TaxID=4537 RepID=A0A0E0LX10_ORYPU
MSDSGFVELKVDFPPATDIAVGDIVPSDVFQAGGHIWRANSYPHGNKEDSDEYLSLGLQLMAGKSNNVVKAIFDAFLMEKDGKPSSSIAKWLVQTYQANNPRLRTYGWPRFVKRSDLDHQSSSFVVDGKVRIMCVAIVLHEDDNNVPVPPPSPPPPDIGLHLGRLLDRGDGTDVSFVVDGETFPAHRAVLAARSPVFQAELFGSMEEANISCITLHEIEPVTFRALLRFIYTDELTQDDVEFQKLLAAADRYDMSRLRLLCARKLWETMSVDAVATTLVYAEMHGCPELKKRCLGFFVQDKNFDEVVLTEGYLQLMQRFPLVIDEIRDLRRAKRAKTM